MKKIPLILSMVLVFGGLLLPLAGCGSTVTVEDVTPGELLEGLPVYPDAVAIDTGDTWFIPAPVPKYPDFKGRPPDIEFETVSQQYSVESPAEQVLDWYDAKLTTLGYVKYSDTYYYFLVENKVHAAGYYKESLPLLSVEIHALERYQKTYFAVVVSRDTTTELNPEPPIPDDITGIDVTYFDADGTVLKITEISDSNAIQNLTASINALPFLPDAPIIPKTKVFSMVLHRQSGNSIDMIYSFSHTGDAMVRISGTNMREDTEGKLLTQVKKLIGVSN